MKKLLPIFLVAFIANLLTVLAGIYLSSLGNKNNELQGALLMIILPLMWLLTIIIALVLSILKHREIFKKSILAYTILLLLCCTPVPVVVISLLCRPPEMTSTPSVYTYKGGKAYKTESWYYVPDGKKYVDKTFIADSALERKADDDSEFRKDGVWVYYKTNGDTLKTEYWINGRQAPNSK